MESLVERHQTGWARDLLSTFPAVVVQGARQVGKSTFAGVVCADRDHVSVTLDDIAAADAAHIDPTSFVEQAGPGTLVIDEIQRDTSLLLAIKASIDRDRRPGRFLLTGSSDLLRLTRTPDSLAGRAVTLELRGLSQGELAGEREDFAAWVRSADGDLGGPDSTWTRQDYVRAIARGGYPEVRDFDERMRGVWFDSYLERVLHRDIGDVSRGLSSDRLTSIIRLVAANQGGEMVQARLADELAIPKSAVASYLSALETLCLTNDVAPWRANLTKREIGRHKVSVADSGLALRLARLTPAGLSRLDAASTVGRQLEAFVVAEILKQRGWSGERFEVGHFRDRDGLEVDVVLEFADGSAFLVEVKATATYRAEHVKAIRELAGRLGDRFLGGAVLGLSPHRVQLARGVWGVPVSVLWDHAG